MWICAFLVREGCPSSSLLLGYNCFWSKVDFVVGKRKGGSNRMHVLTKQIQRRHSFPSLLSLSLFLSNSGSVYMTMRSKVDHMDAYIQ